jgi:hypothetical protein
MSANTNQTTTSTYYAAGLTIQCRGGGVEFAYMETFHVGNDSAAYFADMEQRGYTVWPLEVKEVPVRNSRRNSRRN